MTVAVIALVVALCGTGYAAFKLPKKSVGAAQLKKDAVRSPKVKNDSLTGADVNEGTLATVPSAVRAANAVNSGNADKLGGLDPNALKQSLKPRCPSDMRSAADVCYEDSLRADVTFDSALATCAAAERRLPTSAELALVFAHSGAPQPVQWVATQFFESTTVYGLAVGEDSSRKLTFAKGAAFSNPFRCVTSPSNP